MLQLIGLIDPTLIDLALIDQAVGPWLSFVWLPWPFDCRRGGLVGLGVAPIL